MISPAVILIAFLAVVSANEQLARAYRARAAQQGPAFEAIRAQGIHDPRAAHQIAARYASSEPATSFRDNYGAQNERYGYNDGARSFQYTFLKGSDLLNQQHAEQSPLAEQFAIQPPQYAHQRQIVAQQQYAAEPQFADQY